MRIDAITSCVGPKYVPLLRRSLPIWLDTCDHVTVVTKPGDDAVNLARSDSNLTVITTDVFTRYDADFNKAAALCEAYATAQPTDWVLHFDADITPPSNWRKLAEPRVRVGHLHGVRRYSCDGHDFDRHRFWPFGYFQLWQATDFAAMRWPIFDCWHGHAGCYDADFVELWPKFRWRDLRFQVTHTGDPRSNWFGDGNDEKMKPLLKYGLLKYRKDQRDRLVLPAPEKRLSLQSNDPSWLLATLGEIARTGPFRVHAEVNKQMGPDWTVVTPGTELCLK